jgi:hypothetical protein
MKENPDIGDSDLESWKGYWYSHFVFPYMERRNKLMSECR